MLGGGAADEPVRNLLGDLETPQLTAECRSMIEGRDFAYLGPIRSDGSAAVTPGLGEAVAGINVDDIPEPHRLFAVLEDVDHQHKTDQLGLDYPGRGG